MTFTVAQYTVAYRPIRRQDVDQIETWPIPLAVGETLPVVPLSPAADFCLAVDLDVSYLDACRRRRIHDALT